MPRARLAPEPPAGLVYRPELLTAAEERELLEHVESLEFQEIVMKGVVARRTAARFGMGYDYDRRTPTPGASPIPDWLVPVRDRGGRLAGIAGDELVQVLVQRYPPGAPIGWHRDSPAYELVVGISLLSPARMRFRRGSTHHWTTYELELPPRSAYILDGESRRLWQHSIPPMKSLRYSITFRTLTRIPHGTPPR